MFPRSFSVCEPDFIVGARGGKALYVIYAASRPQRWVQRPIATGEVDARHAAHRSFVANFAAFLKCTSPFVKALECRIARVPDPQVFRLRSQPPGSSCVQDKPIGSMAGRPRILNLLNHKMEVIQQD